MCVTVCVYRSVHAYQTGEREGEEKEKDREGEGEGERERGGREGERKLV